MASAVLRMYNVGGKLFYEINSMYVNGLACVRVKEGESECFKIDRGVRQGCIISPWLFNVYMDAVMKEMKMRRRGGSGNCLASRIQMTWFYVVNWKKT